MKNPLKPLYLSAVLLLASAAFAQTGTGPPPGAPAGSAGQCNDGTYSSAATRKGACSAHQGVQTWWGAPASTTASPTASAPAASAAAPAAAPATAPAKEAAPTSTVAPGGGPGQVWVNGGSKVYHCQGDLWYGTTKQGQYMSEADAKAAGDRPAHGKNCS
jgi:hypothetical protein